jgi:hypothetical protein
MRNNAMLFRPFLLLLRNGLGVTAILSLLAALLVVLTDLRYIYIIFFYLYFLIGVFLGRSRGYAQTRFLFTRPIPRSAVLLRPLAVTSVAIAVFPVAALLLLLGCQHLLHATALGRPAAMVALIPSASGVAQPSLVDLLATIHFARYYLATLSIGLCAYTVVASAGWFTLSPSKWVRSLSSLPAFLIFLLIVSTNGIAPRALGTLLLLLPPRGAGLDYLPSTSSIALHFVFAAGVVYACWRIVQCIDELPESGRSSAATQLEEAIRSHASSPGSKINYCRVKLPDLESLRPENGHGEQNQRQGSLCDDQRFLWQGRTIAGGAVGAAQSFGRIGVRRDPRRGRAKDNSSDQRQPEGEGQNWKQRRSVDGHEVRAAESDHQDGAGSGICHHQSGSTAQARQKHALREQGPDETASSGS